MCVGVWCVWSVCVVCVCVGGCVCGVCGGVCVCVGVRVPRMRAWLGGWMGVRACVCVACVCVHGWVYVGECTWVGGCVCICARVHVH